MKTHRQIEMGEKEIYSGIDKNKNDIVIYLLNKYNIIVLNSTEYIIYIGPTCNE